MSIDASLRDQVIALRDEMNAALSNGAFFNPEMFSAMLQRGDNPVLRWRDQLDTLLSGIAPTGPHAAPGHWR